MTRIAEALLPDDSLLAQRRGEACYRDCFTASVPGEVSLPAYISAFYASAAFLPERMALHLIGRGASKADIAELAADRTRDFAAWSVEAREHDQVLLRDFQDRTCSWLAVSSSSGVADGAVRQPIGQTKTRSTRLYFGSGVRHPDGLAFQMLMPVHRWYARQLLAGAVRGLA